MIRHCHFLAILILLFTACQNSNKPEIEALQTKIDSIKQKYAPDRRVNVFDIEISGENGKLSLKGYTNVPEASKDLSKLIKDENLTDSIKLLPDKELGDTIYGVITLSVADIRTNPDFASEMATQAILGTPVKLLQKDGWCRIQTPDGYIGWTQRINFRQMTGQEIRKWNLSKKVVFTDYFGFSYQQPDKNSQTISDLVAGNFLKYEGEQGGFYKVSYPDGRTAYVMKSQAKLYDDWISSINLSGESIVKTAFTLAGIPYVWGGTSAKGMDCSGFTKTVLFMHGIILMRDASQQAYTGIPVDISNGRTNLRIGDMLFFGEKAENGKKERIRHVGFYIGNDEFIHASGYVRVSSLNPDSPDYGERNATEFIRASRIIGAVDKEGSNIWSINNNPFYR